MVSMMSLFNMYKLKLNSQIYLYRALNPFFLWPENVLKFINMYLVEDLYVRVGLRLQQYLEKIIHFKKVKFLQTRLSVSNL